MAENRFLQSPQSQSLGAPEVPDAPAIPAYSGPLTSAASLAPSAVMKGSGLMPPSSLQPVFESAAADSGVPLNVLTAIAQQESGYNPSAIGELTKWGKAKGIMQNLDMNAADGGIDSLNPEQSIRYAAKQIRKRLDRGDSMEEAVKAHFGGDSRKAWGPKTEAYGREVMAKADAIGQQYLSSAPGSAAESPATPDLQAIQSEMDAKEPGRYKVIDPAQIQQHDDSRARIASGVDALADAKKAAGGYQAPSPYPIDTQDRIEQTVDASPAPSPLTTKNQARAKAGYGPVSDLPPDGFVAATGKALKNLPENFKNAAGGIIRNQGEAVDDQTLVANAGNAGVIQRMQENGDITMVQNERGQFTPTLRDGRPADTAELARYIRNNADDLLSAEEAGALVGMKPSQVTAYGKKLSKEANRDKLEINPDGPLAKYGSMIIGSTAEMVPAIVASVVTKNPAVGMSMIGGQVFGQSYDNARTKGLNAQDASNYAMAQAAAEAIPEALPIHIIMKPGQNFFKGLFQAGAAEAMQEGVTQLIQSGLDKGSIDPNMTWAQAREAIADAMIVGAGAGVALKAGVSGAQRAASSIGGGREAAAAEAGRVEPGLGDPVSEPDTGPSVGDTSEAVDQPGQAVPDPAGAQSGQTQQPEQSAQGEAAAPAPAPDAARGPLEAAAASVVQENPKATLPENSPAEPVTVRGEDGNLSGMLESYAEDGQGGWTARVLADDGNSYEFTQADGVQLDRQQNSAEAQANDESTPDVADAVADLPAAETPGVADAPIERPLEGLSVTDLRGELKAVASAIKADPKNPDLKTRRKAVEKAIRDQVEAVVNGTAPAVAEVAGEKVNKAWSRFADDSGSLGIPRAEMPQIKAEHRGAMVNFLGARGITSVQEEVPASTLKPTQEEFSPAKVKKALGFTGGDRSILVSSDNHVLDGHHQWMAKLDGDQTVKIIRLGAPIRQLLKDVREFPSVGQAGGSPAETQQQDRFKPSSTGLREMGGNMAKAMTDNFYGGWFDLLARKPEASGAFRNERRYRETRAAYDAGQIKSVEDLRDFLSKESAEPVTKQTKDATKPADGFTKPAEIATETAKADTPAAPREFKTPKQKAFDRKILIQRKDREQIGVEEGEKFTLSGDVGYASAGKTYTVDSINTDGSVTVSSESGSTTLSRAELQRAKNAGISFTPVAKAEKPAPVAATEESTAVEAPASGAENAPVQSSEYGANNKLVTKDRAVELRAKLKAKLNGSQLNAGIDPEVLAMGTELAVFHIEAGVRKFADFARTMAADLDMPLSKVRPYLRSWYNGARDMMEDSGASVSGMDDAAAVKAGLSGLSDDAVATPPVAEAKQELAEGVYSHDRHPEVTATVRKTDKGFSVEWAPDDVQEFRGINGEAKAIATLTREGYLSPASEVGNESGSRGSVERDSQEPGAAQSVVPAVNGDVAGQNDRGAGQPGGRAREKREAGQRDQRVPADGAIARGERGDQLVHQPDGQFRPEVGTAGSAERTGSGSDSGPGAAVEQKRAADIVADAPASDAGDFTRRLEAQRKAGKAPTKLGDKASIDEALPLLLPEQRDDVLKAEQRHAVGNGMLHTNGTGTGKTASGLGLAKRFINDGKDNIAIVVPSDKIASDWVKFAKMMGIELKQLADTSDNGGAGPIITTYANFAANDSLALRDWDLAITDESHYLSSNESGETTGALEQLRALTGHHAGFYRWASARFPKERRALDKAIASKDQASIAKAEAAWQAITKPEKAKWEKRWAEQDGLPKTLFLSATPFPYVKNVDYAEGYLFDYVKPADLKRSEGRSGAYNSGSPREQFFMRNFGYRMRTNKLTAPEAGVDSELMEQNFNQWLKSTGALSGRRLEVPFDYDRKFAVVDDAVGQKIDEGLKFLREDSDGRYREVYDGVMKQFDYHRRQYLLESIKARAAVPIIKEHMKLGRKVVVFHDFNKGGGFDPFVEGMNALPTDKPGMDKNGNQTTVNLKALAQEAMAKRPDLFKLDLKGLRSPIATLGEAFDNALFFNGTVPKKQRRANADAFNDDNGANDLIVVQSDAGREGVSLHDTTGERQRVLINLGMPGKPVAAIQIEGRTYRTGQASDAIFRYLTTGTAWEASAFASKIAERASTAENLALGTDARGLKQSFIDAYTNADLAPASAEDGKGGKAYDRNMAAGLQLSGFTKAKTYYFAQQKNARRRDQREGADYYATPEPVGFKMAEWANIQQGDKVLEPSAGHGAIARFFPDRTDVTMVEPSYELSQRAALANGAARIVNERFEDLHISNKYDAVVMNPPYGSGGKTAIEHVSKAAKHLRDGGRIVAMIPRGGITEKRLEAFLGSEDAADLYLVAKIDMPASTFERAGTAVNTQVLVLEKHVNSEDATGIQQRNIDLSSAENIGELFDSIEDIGMPDRIPSSKPEPKEEIVEHTTGKGKVLRGFIRKGLTRDEAKAIDPFTFKKDGGYFIRAKYLDQGKQSVDAYRGFSLDIDGAKFSVQPDGLRSLVEAEPLDLAVAPELAARPLAEVRAEAFGNLLANRSTTMTHPSVGTITFNRAGITKSRSTSNDPAKVLTMDHLGEIVSEAAYLGRSEPEGDSANIVRYHYLGRRLTVDGEPMLAMITLRENADGKISYYNHSMLQDAPTIESVTAPQAANDNAKYQRPALRMERLSLSDGTTATPGQADRIRGTLTAGAVGKAIGRLIDSGRIVLHDTVETLPGRALPGTQAMTMPDGTVHLVAENLTPQTAMPVMLHEMFHAGGESLVGSKRWGELQGRLESLHRQFSKSPGKAGEFYAAAQRVADAQRAGNAMSEDLTVEEFGAYAIEQYESAPATIRKWVDDVIGAIKEFMYRRFGIQLGQVSPSQLRAMAVEAIRTESIGAREGLAASMANVTNTPAFKRWFGKSVVLNEDSEPGVVHHFTYNDFTEFNRQWAAAEFGRNPEGIDTLGSWFTDNEKARYVNPEMGRRMDVYLSIKKPFYIDDIKDGDAFVQLNDMVKEAGGSTSLRERLQSEGYDGVILSGTYLDGVRQNAMIAFEPNQIKSATDNSGNFDGENPDIRHSLKPSRVFKDLSAEQKTFLDKIGPERLPQRLKDRWSQLTDNLGLRVRQAGVDRYAALLRNDKALLGEDTLDGSIADSSWVLARMSPSAGGAVSALLNNGRIYLDAKEKVIDIKDGTKGLADTLRKLGSPVEIDRFMGWIAANRSKRLLGEGRENLFTPAEIEAGIKLSGGKLENGKSRSILYAQAWKEFQQHRDDVLGIAQDAGIITPEQRDTWSEEFYVPFYRVMDEESVGGPSSGSGISRQQAYKKLKGGKQNLNDLLDNTLLNFHHLLQASLKNQAAAQAMTNAEKLGIADKTTENKRDKKMSTFVMVGGEKQWFNVSDALTFKAVSSLADAGLNNPVMRVGRAFKRFFTNMTTITPQFVIANGIRDTLAAMATSPTSMIPLKTAFKGALTYGNDSNKARMMASGGAFSFGHVYGQNANEIKASLTSSMRTAQVLSDPKLIPNILLSAWRKYHAVTDFAENINRAGIWEHNKDRGKLKAAFEARDLMDFSAHGDAAIVRIMTDLVPFLNARIQGLDKLYRAGGKPAIKTLFGKGSKSDKQSFARFLAVVGALTAVSALLYLRNRDDEEYRKLEDWQRDSYWVMRFGENMYFIPKPFEVGAIATMGERLLEQFVDPTVGGEKLASRMAHMLTDTFAFNPIPQVVKPLYELGANENTFTGRPIEDQSMQRLSPSLRSRPETSRLSEGASRSMEAALDLAGGKSLALSPVQIDHLIQGYTGAVGSGAVGLADTIWRRASGEELPARRWSEYQPIKRFYKDLTLEDNYTRYGTDFYTALKKSDQAYADLQHLVKYGQEERAVALENKQSDELALRGTLNKVARDMGRINAEMKRIQVDKSMSGESKRIELDRLRSMRNLMTEEVGKELEAEKVRKDAFGG